MSGRDMRPTVGAQPEIPAKASSESLAADTDIAPSPELVSRFKSAHAVLVVGRVARWRHVFFGWPGARAPRARQSAAMKPFQQQPRTVELPGDIPTDIRYTFAEGYKQGRAEPDFTSQVDIQFATVHAWRAAQ